MKKLKSETWDRIVDALIALACMAVLAAGMWVGWFVRELLWALKMAFGGT